MAENSNELPEVWSDDTEYIRIVLKKSNFKKCRFLIISLDHRHTDYFSLVRRFGVAIYFIIVIKRLPATKGSVNILSVTTHIFFGKQESKKETRIK